MILTAQQENGLHLQMQAAALAAPHGSMSILALAQQAFEKIPEAPMLQNQIAESALKLAALLAQVELYTDPGRRH